MSLSTSRSTLTSPRETALAVIACEVDEIDLGLEAVAVQRPDEVGGEDEASLEHGDHHEVVEPSLRQCRWQADRRGQRSPRRCRAA